MTDSNTILAGCKINLGLNITQRRPDGYHDLQTIFYPVPLFDELRIREVGDPPSIVSGNEDRLTLAGNPLEGDVRDNLVLKAVRLLRSEGYEFPPLCIDLKKVIPSGAGLGGGSSDAACVLKAVAGQYGLPLSLEQMEQLAGRLGADCPFFIRCKPVYAEGIGDQFTSISLSLKGMYLLLVKPEVHVSTREAYAGVHPHQPRFPLLETINLPVEQWKDRMENDFEQSIFASHPLLSNIKQELYRRGAVYASMSGSGSTIFGLFRSQPSCGQDFAEHFTFLCRL